MVARGQVYFLVVFLNIIKYSTHKYILVKNIILWLILINSKLNIKMVCVLEELFWLEGFCYIGFLQAASLNINTVIVKEWMWASIINIPDSFLMQALELLLDNLSFCILIGILLDYESTELTYQYLSLYISIYLTLYLYTWTICILWRDWNPWRLIESAVSRST